MRNLWGVRFRPVDGDRFRTFGYFLPVDEIGECGPSVVKNVTEFKEFVGFCTGTTLTFELCYRLFR